MEVMSSLILIGASLLAVSAVTSVVSFRAGVPILLIFLGIGLLAGEDGLGLGFDNQDITFFIASLALAVILFDSGFQTRLQSLRVAAWPAGVLATLGVALTAALVAPVAWLVLDLSWMQALLLGAIVGSTDAAAVFFLLRVGGVTIGERVRSTLEIESGSNDPMAIFLTMALVEVLIAGVLDPVVMGLFLATQFGLGLGMGLLGGWLIATIVNRLNVDGDLYPILVLALSLIVFSGANLAGGSGFLAAYVAGLTAGNLPLRTRLGIVRFQNGMTWLAQIVMFVALGLFATPSEFPALMLPALAVAAALIFLARPLAIWLCLLPFGFTRNEVAFVSWVGLRGAVSILLALIPLMAGLEQAQVLFNMAFLVVLASLLLQGTTIATVARWLGVRVPVPKGAGVERIELEVPRLPGYELVGYDLTADSAAAQGERIPRWARPTLILREGKVLTVQSAGRLQAGDRVYLLTSSRRIALLDRLFGTRRPLAEEDHAFFGDFVLSPDATLGGIAAMYGVPIPDDQHDQTLRALFEKEFRTNFAIGDRLALGPVELVVRAVENESITSIGLAVEPTAVSRPRLPLFQTRKELKSALKRLFRIQS